MPAKHAVAEAQPSASKKKIAWYKAAHYDTAIEENLPVELKQQEGALGAWSLNAGQRGLHTLWEQIRLLNLKRSMTLHKLDPRVRVTDGPVYIVILKARQVGMSSYCQARFLIHAMWTDNFKVNITAHKAKASENILSKAHTYFENWRGDKSLWYQRTKGSDTEIAWSHGSRLVVATAGSEDSERSFSYRAVHLSEAAFFPGWAGVNATLQAVPDDGTVIMESTGNGTGGPFYDTWDKALPFEEVVQMFEEHDEDKKAGWNGYFRYFFGWHQDPDNRRPLTAREKAYVRNTLDQAETDLVRILGLDEEQLEWRRHTIKKKCQNQPGMSPEEFFCQEHPSTPAEAFITRGSKFFQPMWLEREEKHIRQSSPLCRVELSDNLPPVQYEQTSANLRIYDPPLPGHHYVIGMDAAEGIEGGDYSVARVWDRTFPRRRAVAMWRSRRMEPTAFADCGTILGEFYNMAYINNEASGAFGRVVSQRLIDNEYPYLYFNQRAAGSVHAANTSPTNTVSVGFATHGQSRGDLLATLQMAVRDGLADINDPEALREYKLFEVIDRKAQAPAGENDDIVIADALALHFAKRLGAPDLADMQDAPEVKRATEGEVWQMIRKKVSRDETKTRKRLGKSFFPRIRQPPK